MPIRFECSECGKSLRAPEEKAGRKIRCPACEAVTFIPEADSEPEYEEADEEPTVTRRTKSARSAKSARPSPNRTNSTTSSKSRRQQSSDDDDDDDDDEIPQTTKRKKSSKKNRAAKSGGVPVWAIALGASTIGLLAVGAVVFVALNMSSNKSTDQKQKGGAKGADYILAETNSPIAKFKMKWEMPPKWTEENGVEDGLWPWAKMSGQGQAVRIFSNRSLTGMASTMTSMGGAKEMLKTAHTVRIEKLKAENTDYEEGPLKIHEGKHGPVIWTDYEYKGIIGKGYGIRCTVVGPRLPCSVTMECSQSSRDKWRPILLRIAESVHFVGIKANGKEEVDDAFEPEGDDAPPAGNNHAAEDNNE